MKNLVIAITVVTVLNTAGFAQTPFAVSPSGNVQQSPAVSDGVVVWQEYVEYGGQWDWDIYGVDVVDAPSTLISVAAIEADQTEPSIWGTWVVWQDNYYGDTDIWVSDISDAGNVATRLFRLFT